MRISLAMLFLALSTTGCQSTGSEATLSYLESGANVAGQASFPKSSSPTAADAVSETPSKAAETAPTVESSANVAVVPATPARDATQAEQAAVTCNADVTSKTEAAVGNPCATTSSFMESKGFNKKQIAGVIAAGKSVTAH